MRITAALCAVALASTGCALAHERSGPAPTVDAAFVVDAGTDAFVAPDGGPVTGCTQLWSSLPWCPANPTEVLGQPCATEGLLCGVACCEPSPALACTGGVWVRATPPDCRDVDCIAPSPCGTGECGFGRVCLDPSSEIRQPARCVLPPFAATSCGEVPSAWLTEDPGTCSVCHCDERAALLISLECLCCDR